MEISTHALREEGDFQQGFSFFGGDISTHALREEGDHYRGAGHYCVAISTHALREEGDRCQCNSGAPHHNFYPRPP